MNLPELGERVTILWPNGPRDFEMEFVSASDGRGGPGSREGWTWMTGLVDLPANDDDRWGLGPSQMKRTFYVTHVGDRTWTLLPYTGAVPVSGC